jgi:hypothetical protein
MLEQGKAPLPRLSNDTGKAIFLRFTATENFALVRDLNLPVGARIPDFLKMLQGCQTVLQLYMKASTGQDPPLREELAGLLAFMVHVAGTGCDLFEEFRPTIPVDDKFEARVKGLQQANRGMTSVFLGAEQSLAEPTFSPGARTGILRAMEANLPRIRRVFADDVVIELRKKLEADLARFEGEDAAALKRMIAGLR